jgi:hypothetical protein
MHGTINKRAPFRIDLNVLVRLGEFAKQSFLGADSETIRTCTRNFLQAILSTHGQCQPSLKTRPDTPFMLKTSDITLIELLQDEVVSCGNSQASNVSHVLECHHCEIKWVNHLILSGNQNTTQRVCMLTNVPTGLAAESVVPSDKNCIDDEIKLKDSFQCIPVIGITFLNGRVVDQDFRKGFTESFEKLWSSQKVLNPKEGVGGNVDPEGLGGASEMMRKSSSCNHVNNAKNNTVEPKLKRKGYKGKLAGRDKQSKSRKTDNKTLRKISEKKVHHSDVLVDSSSDESVQMPRVVPKRGKSQKKSSFGKLKKVSHCTESDTDTDVSASDLGGDDGVNEDTIVWSSVSRVFQIGDLYLSNNIPCNWEQSAVDSLAQSKACHIIAHWAMLVCSAPVCVVVVTNDSPGPENGQQIVLVIESNTSSLSILHKLRTSSEVGMCRGNGKGLINMIHVLADRDLDIPFDVVALLIPKNITKPSQISITAVNHLLDMVKDGVVDNNAPNILIPPVKVFQIPFMQKLPVPPQSLPEQDDVGRHMSQGVSSKVDSTVVSRRKLQNVADTGGGISKTPSFNCVTSQTSASTSALSEIMRMWHRNKVSTKN